jgi:two-component system phosphate regulon sensor histidine kinase PhoR
MIAKNLFLTLLIYFLLVGLSAVMVSIGGLSFFSFIPVVLSIVFTIIVYREIEKALNNLSDAALKASRGNFEVRYPAKPSWEIEAVGLAFNDLIENVQRLTEAWKANQDELRFILETVTDALWVQRLDGKLLWTSQKFSSLFTTYKADRTQYYWDVIREPLILGYLKAALNAGDPTMLEVELDNKSYLLKGAVDRENEKAIFILQNVDLLKQTEQIKKDFITNAAHELRTPLTAIKGFSEALLETASPENIRYLNIISNHTDRLISLISDIQMLSRLERNPVLNLQEINLVTFFDSISILYQHKLENAPVKLIIELDETMERFRVDPFKFEQIFINLIDNALHHTEQGSITIRTTALPQALQIEVCDTGKGIPAEHIPRIFERFYVVDRSRNKNYSGTGLGLAIVKHAVALHQGTIDVQSSPDTGTCFRLVLPRIYDRY